jgi:uncharacterized protein (DUF169 family)
MTMTAKTSQWRELAARLTEALHLATPPIFLAFGAAAPSGVGPYEAPMSPPAPDGRHGRVSASCVFWMEAANAGEAFSTVAEDHGNCSVGRLTHGLAKLEEVAGNDDIAALLEAGWVTQDMVPAIPVVSERPGAITYGRLEAVPPGVSPDVVMLRVNGRQTMVLSDSIPQLQIQGKPQCHVVAMAKEQGIPAASVGCALSRARTGMRPEEMTCALPASELEDIVRRIETTANTDAVVARYAAEDAKRFNP